MYRQHVTGLNKGKPQFILALDAAYYNIERVFLQQQQRGAFSQPINYFPHEFFLNSVQSYLTIREREYLDESTSYLVDESRNERIPVLNMAGKNKQGDPRYKQLLPYMIARQKQADGTYLYFPYRRTQKVGESRLAGNGSLGYGGHIDLEDVVSSNSVIDLKATILKSAVREAVEEFTAYQGQAILNRYTYDKYISFGDLFIVDNTNDVGELHLGIIMYFNVPAGYRLEASEDELAKLPPMTAEQMLADPTFNPENWTKLYLENVISVNSTPSALVPNEMPSAGAIEAIADLLKPDTLAIDHGGVRVGYARVEDIKPETVGEIIGNPDADPSCWLNHVATSEEQAQRLGQIGIYSPEGVMTPFAKIQNQAAAAYHAAKNPPTSTPDTVEITTTVPTNTLIGNFDTMPGWSNNVDWNNAIQGSPVNAVELKVDEVQAGLAVTNAVSVSAESDQVKE